MLTFCHPWFHTLLNVELFCSQKCIFEEVSTLNSFFPKDSYTGDLIQWFLQQLEFCSPEIQSPDYTLCQTNIPLDHKFNQSVVVTAQSASHISWNTYLKKLHNVTLLKQLLSSSLYENVSHIYIRMYENVSPAAMISLIKVFVV